MRNSLSFAYSLFAYIAFLVAFAALVLFMADFALPRTVDQGASIMGSGAAVLFNLFLVALFGVPHSIMARPGFKRRLTRLIPESIERSTFVLLASASLGVMMAFWQPVPQVLWQIEQPLLVILGWSLFAIGVLMVPISTFLIDHFHLFGLSQTWAPLRGREAGESDFVTPWLYKVVRHPMMLGLLLAFWSVPTMTVGHLTLSAGLSLYVFVGMMYEERDLMRVFGDTYAGYRHRVPQVFPRLFALRHRALAELATTD